MKNCITTWSIVYNNTLFYYVHESHIPQWKRVERAQHTTYQFISLPLDDHDMQSRMTSCHFLLARISAQEYTHTPKSLQCLRLTAIPNQNARHDPCPGTDLAKPLSPLETLALTSLDQTIMVLLCSIRFWSNHIGTPVSNGPFVVGTVDAHNKNAKQALFLVCMLQDGFW